MGAITEEIKKECFCEQVNTTIRMEIDVAIQETLSSAAIMWGNYFCKSDKECKFKYQDCPIENKIIKEETPRLDGIVEQIIKTKERR